MPASIAGRVWDSWEEGSEDLQAPQSPGICGEWYLGQGAARCSGGLCPGRGTLLPVAPLLNRPKRVVFSLDDKYFVFRSRVVCA